MLEEYKKRQKELGEEKLNELKERLRNLPETITTQEDKDTIFEGLYYGLIIPWC